MIIRAATKDDVPEFVAFLNEIIAMGGTTAYQSPKTPDYFEAFFAPGSVCLLIHVAEANGAVVAVQWVRPFDPPDQEIASIASFAKPGQAQRGVASKLFAVTKAACADAGYTQIDATIRADNSGGLAYYGKMGFIEIGRSPDVPLSDGTLVTRIHKRLAL